MRDLLESIEQAWDRMRAYQAPLPVVAAIVPAQCWPEGVAGIQIRRDESYFTIRINEMFLKANQQWYTTFDPLVLVVVQFNYDQRRITVPCVVGPNLIARQSSGDKAKHGVTIVDTLVTGPHPYRGGDVDVSVSFYQVQRQNHARALLTMVERLSAAVGGVGHLDLITKTGAAVLEGIEALLGLGGTTMLAGHRAVFATSGFDPFSSGYYGLLTPPVPADVKGLSVRDRRLYKDTTGAEGGLIAYRDSDFALLGISGSDQRGDENLLPFHALKKRAFNALNDVDGGLSRGRANLLAAYQEMRESPDMTTIEARLLLDRWLEEFEKAQSDITKLRALSTDTRGIGTSDLAADLNSAFERISRKGYF